MTIAASAVRVVKLRNKSEEIRTLDMGHVILTCRDVPEQLAASGDLNQMIQHLLTSGYSAEAASQAAQETWDFHYLGPDCLWIAFARDHLWWTFADPEVIWLLNDFVITGDRVRKATTGWSSADVNGRPLIGGSLSEGITKLLQAKHVGSVDHVLSELVAIINGVPTPQLFSLGIETGGLPPIVSTQSDFPSNLFEVKDVIARPSAAPDAPGFYAWWFDDLPNVPLESCEEQAGFKLAYVGIASHQPGSRRTLRQRLRNHCRGPIATSTLRRSLTAILSDRLDLHPYREGRKVRLPDREEARLSAWLDAHGRVAWISDPMPWIWEQKMLSSSIWLPLNIRGNTHDFAKELSALRRQL